MTRTDPLRVIATILLTGIATLSLVSASLAQVGEPLVTITSVDSQAFPQVAAYVAVTDENGLPVANLTEVDFSLREDGAEVLAETITVEPEVPQDLRLVLAVDTSVPDASLVNIKQGLMALLDTMRPRDKFALLTFADEVSLARDFTNNKADLQAAVDELVRAGDYTVLNEAAAEAISLAAGAVEGRPAVIVITDSRDNRGTLATDSFIERAAQSQTPLTFIGFGSKIQPSDLQALAEPTRGQAIALTSSVDIDKTLLDVVTLLRQGYRITFQSGLHADNARHELAVNVTGGVEPTEGSFVATPNQVAVTLPQLSAGQTVGGRINLTVQVTAPAPLAAVEYLLDGQSLARVDSPPYTFEWDSASVRPGIHTLTARATDQAGNEGETEVELNLVPPLVVTVTTSKPKINIGEQIPIQAKIEALNPIARVEFLLDDQALGENTAPPYSFAFDSSQYTAGNHVMTVRVEDILGQQAEDSFNVEFLAPPPPPLNWPELLTRLGLLLLALIFTILAILFIFFLYRQMVNWQKRRCQRKFLLEVVNQGNIVSPYGLWASEPMGLLKFQFRVSGVPLALWAAAPAVSEPEPLAYYEAPEPVEMVETAPPVPAKAAAKAAPASKGVDPLGSAQQVSDRAMSGGSVIADILGTVGSLLPGSMGNSLRSSANQIRGAQQTVGQATRAPVQMVNTAKRLPGKVGKVVPGVVPAAKSAAPGTRPVSTPVAPAYPAAAPGTRPVATSPKVKQQAQPVAQVTGPTWIETPEVLPGQTLSCDLLIDPINHYRSQDYMFNVTSVSLEQVEQAPLQEQGQVHIRGIFWLARLLPMLLAAVLIAGVVLLAGYAMLWLAGTDLVSWPLLGRFIATIFFGVSPYPFATPADM